jgi:hypothetical protein
MKDAYEILRLKEIELSRVKAEVEALGIVAPLLSDEGDLGADSTPPSTRWTAPPRTIQVPKGANTENRGFPITARDVVPAADSHGP